MSPLRRLLVQFGADRSGAAALTTAIMLVTVLGFVGLGTDLGVAYANRRAAQGAADSAAYSAAVAKLAGAADVTGQARAVAATYGFVHGAKGVQVVVNTPPASGSKAGTAEGVEVIIRRPMARFFSPLFGETGGMVGARAVAVAGASGDACVVAFNPTANEAALVSGSTDVDLIGCYLHANSRSDSAFSMSGSASFDAEGVNVAGGYGLNGNPDLTVKKGVKTNQAPIADPYKDVPIPPYKDLSCVKAPSGSYTFPSQGAVTRICGGLSINNKQSVHFPPGVYVIDGSDFAMNGSATLTGSGVTFVLTSSTGADVPTVRINGGATLNLTAPTGGPTAGMLFFQDRTAGAGDNKINGNSASVLKGAIYFPRQHVEYTGGGAATGGCLQLLADTVEFTGNSTFQVNCEGAGVKSIGGFATALVE